MESELQDKPAAAAKPVANPSWTAGIDRVLLTAALFVLAIDVGLAHYLGEWGPHAGGIFPIPFCLAHVAIAAMYLGIGRSTLLFRLTAFIVALAIWSGPFGVHYMSSQLCIFAFGTTALSALARFFGGRIVRRNAISNSSLRPSQFSLAQLFQLTTVAALLVGLTTSGLLPLPLDWGILAYVICAAVNLVSLITAWGLLSDRLIVAPSVFIGSLVMYFGVGQIWVAIPGEYKSLIGAIGLMQIGLVITLLPVRLMGYRVRFGNRAVAQPA